jgi:hypothetical protein
VFVRTGWTNTVLNAKRMTEVTSRQFPTASVLKHVQCECFKRGSNDKKQNKANKEKREEKRKQK